MGVEEDLPHIYDGVGDEHDASENIPTRNHIQMEALCSSCNGYFNFGYTVDNVVRVIREV